MHCAALSGLAATVLFLLTAPVTASNHGAAARRHMHLHHKKEAMPESLPGNNTELRRRTGTACKFPYSDGMVAVTPNEMNGGWAFQFNQDCYPGRWCPYACKQGYLSVQWNPAVLTYGYPGNRQGGLLCNEDGTVSKGFPDRPFCAPYMGTVSVQNGWSKQATICQTMCPGDEDMLQPSVFGAGSTGDLAAPANDLTPSFICPAAHYYLNPPGTTVENGCRWGEKENPVGNWAKFVFGNNEANGVTTVMGGWNPVALEPATPNKEVLPDYGWEILCKPGAGESECGGGECKYDPNIHGYNELSNGIPGASGAGSPPAMYCLKTFKTGGHATYRLFMKDGTTIKTGDIGTESDSEEAVVSKPAPTPTTTSTTPTPTTTSTTTTPTTTSTTTPSTSSKKKPSSTKKASEAKLSTPPFKYKASKAAILANNNTNTMTGSPVYTSVHPPSPTTELPAAASTSKAGAASSLAAPLTGLLLSVIAMFAFLA